MSRPALAAKPAKARNGPTIAPALSKPSCSPPGKRKRGADDAAPAVLVESPTGKQASSAAKRTKIAKVIFGGPGTPTPAPKPVQRGRKTEARKVKDQELEAVIQPNIAQWRDKFTRAFPGFTFYLDAIDPSRAADIRDSLLELGSTVSLFFDKNVTHIVTSRSVTASAQPSALEADSNALAGDKENVAAKAGAAIFRRRSPVKPTGDRTDVLVKAAELNIKIWDVTKCDRVLSSLIDSHSPTKAPKASLPTLLHQEKTSGVTFERDPQVLRPDYHYFPPTARWVLSEDTTGEHRTILFREWNKPRRGEDPEWPVMHGGADGRCAFTRSTQPVDMPALPRGPVARVQATGGQSLLRKAISLDQLHKRGGPTLAPAVTLDESAGSGESAFLPPNPPKHTHYSVFQAASGNSVVITSNIASATSGLPPGAYGHSAGGPTDKRIVELNRRPTVALSSGAQGRLLPLPRLRRTASVDTGLNATRAPAREQPPKAGYCENCRLRFDDFKQHVVHRKHRKFAEKPSNWVELDAMIRRVERPLGAAYKAACVFNGLLPPPSDELEPAWAADQTTSSIRRHRRARDDMSDEDEASEEDEAEAEDSMAVDDEEDEGADENQVIDVDAEDDDDE